MSVYVREQQGWVAAQEEASQERRVGNKERRDRDFSKKGSCPTAPKQEEQGRSGDNNQPKLQRAPDKSVRRRPC